MTALIVSLNFRVAHVAHLVASYRQMTELGYESLLLIHPKLAEFLPKDVKYITDISELNECSIAIFWFPALKNLRVMLNLKCKFKAQIIYIYHEPIESLAVYRSFGLSAVDIAKIYARQFFQLGLVALSDAIILPSEKAVSLYQKSIARRINKKFYHVPLLFCDENMGVAPIRKYFSYIGTIALDHAYNEFINFICKASEDKDIPAEIDFLIATRNNVEKSEKIKDLVESGRLKIIEGSPLSEAEINQCYAESYGVWNAYHRTTQSGVLAKASMFGTPAIVSSKNLSEFAIAGLNVVPCDNNSDYEEIKCALIHLYQNFAQLSNQSRKLFQNLFNYKVHNKQMLTIIHELTFINGGGVIPLFDNNIYERRAAA